MIIGADLRVNLILKLPGWVRVPEKARPTSIALFASLVFPLAAAEASGLLWFKGWRGFEAMASEARSL